MTNCVVNVSTGPHYRKGQARLQSALKDVGWFDDKGWFLFWKDSFPPNSPPHPTRRNWNATGSIPYAFKPHAFWEAFRQEYTTVLWLDASMVPVQSLTPLIEHVEKHGYWFPPCGWSVGEWCCDSALEALEVSRDDALKIPLVVPGAMGLDLKNNEAFRFLIEWTSFIPTAFRGPWDNKNGEASKDTRVLGHRHDQTVASYLVHKFGWQPTASPKWYAVGDSKDLEWATGEELIIADGNY